jgi:hypothetical protein
MASAQGAATFSVIAKDAASSVLRGVGKQMGSLGRIGSSVFKTLAAVAAAAAAAIVAAAGAALKFAKSAILAAIEDDKEQQKLVATLKARGIASERNLAIVEDLIAAGEKLNFTDSETRKGIQAATQFTDKFVKVRKILAVAQDLARGKEISLEKATILVGRAYNGNTTALSRMGIALDKNATKAETLAAISAKFGGVAQEYSKTLEGQFGQVRISIDETVEAIGSAIGGGKGLPVFVRLLEGIRPIIEDTIAEITKNLPSITKFSDQLVTKFLAKLPGYVATAKRELPILIQNAKDFIIGAGNFGAEVVKYLGPDGLLTAGIAAIGFKSGGLGGAVGAVFAEQFIKMGVDPITASLAATIGSSITTGIVTGFTTQLAVAAVNKFLGLFKSIPITPSLPVGGAVPGALATGGLAAAGIAVSIVAVTAAAAAALSDAITGKGLTNKVGGNNVIDIFGTTAATLADNSKDQGKVLSDLFTFITTGQRPLEINNDLTVKLDGEVLARNIDRRLGITARAAGNTRLGGR